MRKSLKGLGSLHHHLFTSIFICIIPYQTPTMCKHFLGSRDSSGKRAARIFDLTKLTLQWTVINNRQINEEISDADDSHEDRVHKFKGED